MKCPDSSDISALRWINAIVGKKLKWKVVLLLLVQSVAALCGVCYAWLLRELINSAVEGDRSGFLVNCFLLVSMILLQLGIRAVNQYQVEYTRASIENCLKKRLFSMLLNKDYSMVSAIHSGEWMNRLTSDTTVISDTITQVIPGIAGMIVRLTGALVLLLFIAPYVVYIIFPTGVVLLFMTGIFRKKLKQMHRNIQEADGRLRIFFQEYLSEMIIVRVFNKSEYAEERAENLLENHKKMRMQRNQFSNICNFGFGAGMYGFTLLGIIMGSYGILQGTVSYGSFAAIQQLIGQIQSPIASLTGYFPKYYAMIASAERLREAETYLDDSEETQIPQFQIREFYKKEFQILGLHKATFVYPDRTKSGSSGLTVLNGAEITIRKGEYIALVGPSGCGKSTLLKILMALYPLKSGTCFIKGTGEEISLTSAWRGLFSYVPQGNKLLGKNIREIVAFSDEKDMKQTEKIYDALRIACADEFVSKLENGIDTPSGEHGATISEGQMQRLAIARAVFSDHPILLLDEVTSSLDENTEVQVLKNLRDMTDKTVLIVTHRPAALEIVDRIIELAVNE